MPYSVWRNKDAILTTLQRNGLIRILYNKGSTYPNNTVMRRTYG